MFRSVFPFVLAVSLMVSGCAAQREGRWGEKQTAGTVIGGIGGAAIGSAFGSGSGKMASVVAGALAGGFLGNLAGAHLDDDDALKAENAHFHALSTGQPTNWRNPRTGRYGHVSAGPYREHGVGRCREFTSTIYVGGRPDIMRGVACENSDGSWSSVR